MSIRNLSIAALAAAVFGTVALSSAAKANDSFSVSIGQGGFYSIPVPVRTIESAPYALTGSDRAVRNAPVVYQNYGQGQLVIPDVAR